MVCSHALFLLDVREALINSVYVQDDLGTEAMQHYEWVESIRATGGVANDEKDIDAAIASAVYFIWALLETRNIRVYGLVHSGIPYIASYMVSCAMHEDSDIWQLNKPSDDHCELFRKEAGKNTGILEDLLSEAAQVSPKALHFYIASSGVEWGLSMAEFGRRRRAL